LIYGGHTFDNISVKQLRTDAGTLVCSTDYVTNCLHVWQPTEF